jgi:hypothetical protein
MSTQDKKSHRPLSAVRVARRNARLQMPVRIVARSQEQAVGGETEAVRRNLHPQPCSGQLYVHSARLLQPRRIVNIFLD